MKHDLYQIKEYVFEWYRSYQNKSNCMEVIKNEKDVLIIDMTFDNCIAQLIVNEPGFAPYRHVCFEALALNSLKSIETRLPDLIYFFYDSIDLTVGEIVEEINLGVQYCEKYIPEDLENRYINKRGVLNARNSKWSKIIHSSDLKKIDNDSLSKSFTCIGTQFQYLVVKNDDITIRVLPSFFECSRNDF